MISSFIFFSLFPMGLKNYFIPCKFFFFDVFTLFILMIFPLVFHLIKSESFSNSENTEKFLYKIIFFFLFFLLLLCFSCSISFGFLLFLELSSSFMIFFIFNYSKDQDKISSCLFMFLTNIVGSIPFMIFSSSWNFQGILLFMGTSFFSYFIFFCFSLILCSKLPIFFIHFWLTKAHVSASGSGSIILASLMLKIGTMGLLKWGLMFSFLFLSLNSIVFSFFIFSSFPLLLIMTRFFDLKYLVACSSIIHMSLIFPFLVFNSNVMSYSSIMMMVGHGLTSSLLFFLITLLYELNQDRSICSSKSLESYSYSISLILIVWIVLNLGLPPFISFMSEFMFFLCLKENSMIFSVLFILSLILAGIYFINLVLMMLFYKKNIFSNNSSFVSSLSLSLFNFFSFSYLCFFF